MGGDRDQASGRYSIVLPSVLSGERSKAIDGLRAVAVSFVVFFHFNVSDSFDNAGFVGVDVFFAISGYVIALSLSSHAYDSSVSYILEFYRRRLTRLMPALTVCLLVVGIVAGLFVPDSWLSSSNNRTGILAFFGASNFALLADSDGYFGERVEFNPFLHTWSLAVEEQFYLIFPLLLLPWLLAMSGRRRVSRPWVVLIPVVALLSLCWSAWETYAFPQRAFYMLPSRFWELAAGAVLFQLHAENRCLPRTKLEARLLAYVGAALLLLSVVVVDIEIFPFPWTIVPVAGALAIIAAASSSFEPTPFPLRILSSPQVVYLGLCSYSIYLWHWPIAVLLRWTIGFDSPLHVSIALVVTLVAGLVSYRFVELPVLGARAPRSKRAIHVVSLGGGLVALCALCFYVVAKAPIGLSVVDRDPGWSYKDLPGVPMNEAREAQPSASTLWVIGDSHAAAYRGLVLHAGNQLGMNVELRSLSGCSFASLRRPATRTRDCQRQHRSIIRELSERQRDGDVVFLASLRGQRLSDQWGPYSPERIDELLRGDRSAELSAALEEAIRIVREIDALGFRIILDAPKPVYRAPPFRCSDWFNKDNSVCAPGFFVSSAELRKIDEPVLRNLESLKDTTPGLHIWDPFPVLCPGEICSAFRGDVPLFLDQDHLSGHGNKILLPHFVDALLCVSGVRCGSAELPSGVMQPNTTKPLAGHSDQ